MAKAKKPKKSTKQLDVFHGTAGCYEVHIRARGVVSKRASGLVYVAPEWRALLYAKAWAVGLHAVGEMASPIAVVAKFRVSVDELRMTGNGADLVVKQLPPDRLVDVAKFDLSSMSPEERAGHLFNFLGVVGWEGDGYVTDEFKAIAERATTLVRSIPREVTEAGLKMVPCV